MIMLDAIYGLNQTFSSFVWPAAIILIPLYLCLWFFETHHLSMQVQGAQFGSPRGTVKPSAFKDVQVTKILIHPIKSCRGTSVQFARYTPEGFEHDRAWAIIDATTHVIITARQVSKMVLIHPHIIADRSSPYGDRLEVSFPADSGCETFSVPLKPPQGILRHWETTDRLSHFENKGIDGYICGSLPPPFSLSPSAILSRYIGRPVHLVFKGPRPRLCEGTPTFPGLNATVKYQDGYPLLVVSEESVESLQKNIRPLVGMNGVGEKWRSEKLEVERFRPNIVVKGAGIPFAEDLWEEIAIGPERNSADANIPGITLVRKCTRCLLPNVDNKTGIRDPAVPFKVLMKVRAERDEQRPGMQVMFGINAVAKGNGVARVGDWVTVRRLL